MSDFIKQNVIDISFKKGEPWVILTKIEQQIKEKIEKYGTPLGKWPDIKINYGIKTGCNEAFIISSETRADILKGCSSKNEYDKTDKIIRPILRGRDIKQGSYEWAGLYLIALVPSKHYKIEEFPAIKHYLEGASWSDEVPNGYGKLKLEQTGKSHVVNGIKFTSRKATGNKWFETQDQIAYMDDFDKQIIVWQRITQRNNFCITQKGMLVLDSTAFLTTSNHMESLLFQLNSKLFYYWMRVNVHEYGESGFRLSNQYVAVYPALNCDVTNESQLYERYSFTKEEIEIIESKE